MKCECGSSAINEDPDNEFCDICYYKIPLLNILARIHRDGGHYTSRHGLKRAVKDAERIVSNWVME